MNVKHEDKNKETHTQEEQEAWVSNVKDEP